MFWYLFNSWYFLWGRHVNLGELDWRLVRVRHLISYFLVAQVVNGRSKTQTDQAKDLWRIEPRAPLSLAVLEF